MDKINGEIKRVIGSGGADHCDRIDFKLYDRTGAPGILMAFIIGAILLIVGMMFFTLGAEMSMTPMGERIGTRIAQSKRLPVIIGLCFILGFIITISEPDLQVLAGQVPSVSNMTLILAVAVGVGIFLVAAVLRMLFSNHCHICC